MTLDDAIEHAIEVAKEQKLRSGICTTNDNECDKFSSCIKCAEEHEQLAEWLEELKFIRQWKSDVMDEFCTYDCNSVEEARQNGYNKALDDFAEKLKSECREHYIDCDPYFGGITDSILYEDEIEEIAEQLKAGGTE